MNEDKRGQTSAKVSVMMITYNHEAFIRQAIESVLMQQTTFPVELVIGEDCSTDGTRAIVCEYGERFPERIRLLLPEKNQGMQANGIATLKACSGQYIALLEGDDYWTDPDKLQRQVDFLESNPGYGLVHSDVYVEDMSYGRKKLGQAGFVHSGDDTENADIYLALLKATYRIYTCSVCVRRDLMSDVAAANPYEVGNLRFISGDRIRWLEMARITKFKRIAQPLATYRVLPESASKSRKLERILEFQRSSYDLRKHYIAKYGCPTDVSSAIIRSYAWRFLALSYSTDHRELGAEARDILTQSNLTISPGEALFLRGSESGVGRRLLRPFCHVYLRMRRRCLARKIGE